MSNKPVVNGPAANAAADLTVIGPAFAAPAIACPHCNAAAETVVGMNDPTPPTAGRIFVCNSCFRFGVFDNAIGGGLYVRLPTLDEADTISEMPVASFIVELRKRKDLLKPKA